MIELTSQNSLILGGAGVLFFLVICAIVYIIKRRKGNKKLINKETAKNYAIFLEYSSIFGLEDLVQDNGFVLQTISNTQGFIVFPADSQKFPEEKIIKLFLEFKKRGLNLFASAHSQPFEVSKEKIKELIKFTKELSQGSKGLFISSDIFTASKNYQSMFKSLSSITIGEKIINRYVLSN